MWLFIILWIIIGISLGLLIIQSSYWMLTHKQPAVHPPEEMLNYYEIACTELNYYEIARTEKLIWGQTFHNPDPPPGRYCACDTCTGNTYKSLNIPYVYPSKRVNTQAWQDHEFGPTEREL